MRTLHVGNKDYDLSPHIPFKIKVWNRMKAQFGITPKNINEMFGDDIGLMAKVLHELFKDIDPSVPLSDFEELTMDDMGRAFAEAQEIDRPSSSGSTSSPESTAGPPQT